MFKYHLEHRHFLNDIDCLIVPSRDIKIAGVYWATPLLGDTTIFFMTLRKSREYAMSISGTPLLEVFLRDGILYYIVILFTHMLNLLLFMLAPADIKPIGSSLSHSVTTVLVGRLVLNLRQQNTRRQHDGPLPPMTGTEPRTTGTAANLTSFFDFELDNRRWSYTIELGPSSRADLTDTGVPSAISESERGTDGENLRFVDIDTMNEVTIQRRE